MPHSERPSSSSSLAKGKASSSSGSLARVRPAAVRPVATGSSGFSPSFPALDEDPARSRLEGWLALEEESGALLRLYDRQRRVVLVLGEPTVAALELLVATASEATLLVLPKPSSSSSASTFVPKLARTVHLKTSPADGGLGKVFEEAIAHALKWKKGCPTRRPQSWLGSAGGSSRRSSFVGPPSAAPVGGRGRADRPLDVVLHYVNDPSTAVAGAAAASPPSPPTSFRHHPTAQPRRAPSVNLQGMLSSAFLVTSASLPFLSSRAFTGLSTPSEPTLRRPAPAVTHSRSGSAHSAASFASSSSVLPPPPLRSLTSALGAPPDAVLLHVLPSDAPTHFPHLLDGFMQTFLGAHPRVLMAVIPDADLSSSPGVAHDPPLSAASELTVRPVPSILALLLAGAVRPPLPPVPALSSRSRRGSAASIQSLRSSASGLSALRSGAAAAAAAGELPTFISRPEAVSYVPIPTAYPHPASPGTRAGALPSPTAAAAFVVVTPPPEESLPRPASPPPVPELIPSSSSSSSAASSDETSLPPPALGGLKSRSSVGSFATSAGGGTERRKGGGGLWSRLFGRKSRAQGVA